MRPKLSKREMSTRFKILHLGLSDGNVIAKRGTVSHRDINFSAFSGQKRSVYKYLYTQLTSVIMWFSSARDSSFSASRNCWTSTSTDVSYTILMRVFTISVGE